MSEMTENVETHSNSNDVCLEALFAFKMGMTTVYGESGEAVPVTVLRYEPMRVSQIKTVESDGYRSVQVAFRPKRAVRTSDAEKGHLKRAGFENGAYFVREIRQKNEVQVALGATISLESLKKGDLVSVRSRTKGRGFQGSVKRFGFAGGPAAHGSKFHRQPGSAGNRTWPGRVMPGKRYPGHYGDENVTIRNLKVVDVMLQEHVILIKGAVPGARNSIVELVKE